jgi:hypothetical protein
MSVALFPRLPREGWPLYSIRLSLSFSADGPATMFHGV